MWCAARGKLDRDLLLKWIRPPGPVADGLRIGLLGGSFNPAHEGHLYVSETALKRLKLDYVWWLVSPQNPLKNVGDMADLKQRLEGARGMARHHPRLIVTDLESLLGTRYTIDTLAALRRRFPNLRFVWLMGSDNLAQFSRWRRWRDIAALMPLVVVQRPGSILAALQAVAARRFGTVRNRLKAPAITVLDGARNRQSATWLRRFGAGASGMLNQQP